MWFQLSTLVCHVCNVLDMQRRSSFGFSNMIRYMTGIVVVYYNWLRRRYKSSSMLCTYRLIYWPYMDIGSGKSIKHYVKSTIFGNLMEIYQNQSSIKYIFSKVIRSMIIICFSINIYNKDKGTRWSKIQWKGFVHIFPTFHLDLTCWYTSIYRKPLTMLEN